MSVGFNASNMFFGSGEVAPDSRPDDGGGIPIKVALPISLYRSVRPWLAA
jgi:hypothetical protein